MPADARGLPVLLDIEGVAELLHISTRHVRRLVFERRIPYLKVGSRVRFDRAEVASWIDTLRVVDQGVIDAKASTLALVGLGPPAPSSLSGTRDRARPAGRNTTPAAEARPGRSTAMHMKTDDRSAGG
jgi:excisionase family DNA binding protein